MIINGDITVAYRCPDCGKIKTEQFSIFKLSKGNKVYVGCGCSKSKMQLNLGQGGMLWIKLPCIGCDLEHIYKYSIREIIKSQLTVITCPNMGIELCFIGNNDHVKQFVNAHIDDVRTLVKELDFL